MASPGDGRPRPETVQQAAHDLRQPIAVVLAAASAALTDPRVPDPVRRCLEQIEDQAHWISKIIQDMLAGPAALPSAEPVDIAKLVRDAVDSEQLTCAQRISLHQPYQEPRYVMAVTTRLRRALANVLANATHAAGPDGHVELTERVDGDTELIEIVDDGPGFGPATAGGGTGIGLQIAQEMLAECGGRIEVDRLASAQTLVRLLLPIMTDGHTAGGGR
jgi:two-component system, OmpR family, sensor histidine kinase SenX3